MKILNKEITGFFILLCLCNFKIFGQTEIKRTFNWIYGDNKYLRITPVSFADLGPSPMNAIEGSACISDTMGNLLFYTDGKTVWNKSHTIMSNGTGLLGEATVTQNSIIVPYPEQPTKYIIFTNNYNLWYSIVDMTLNGGLGAVTIKNVHLIDHIGEQLTACYHKNKTDIWVMVRQNHGRVLYSFLVSTNGVKTEPVRSYSSITPQGFIGSLKVSPNGKKIVFTNYEDGIVELMCFNNENGRICRNELLSTNFWGAYGAEFSSNSTRLYINAHPGVRLSQYDLTVPWDNIGNTEIILATTSNTTGMQLASDGSIYLPNVGRIQYPNNLGTGCNYTGAFYTFPISGTGTLGITNFISSYFDTDTLELDTTSCECNLDEGKLPLIPNVITPDGDEVNEGFGFGNENFDTYSLKVFSRWGELVFQTEDPSIFFEGKTNNGKLLASGTYYIIFKYQLTGATTAHEYHGSIMVLGEDN